MAQGGEDYSVTELTPPRVDSCLLIHKSSRKQGGCSYRKEARSRAVMAVMCAFNQDPHTMGAEEPSNHSSRDARGHRAPRPIYSAS